MRRILILGTAISGHNLEYYHHLYMAALNEYRNDFFILVVPESFNEVKDKFDWPQSDNIQFYYLSNEALKLLQGNSLFAFPKLIKRLVNQYQITNVFLFYVMLSLPFLPLFLNKKCKVSGIIYYIYLYEWKKISFFRKVQNVIKYYLLSTSAVYSKFFVLNDMAATSTLNRLYSSSKFVYLPDPVSIMDKANIHDIRRELEIEEDKTICLQFGSLQRYKGSIDILIAIKNAINENVDLSKYVFIFAGVVHHDIKDLFYELYNEIKDKSRIIVYDEFCTYEFIGALCQTSDVILCPYRNANQSSGVIGYAAQFYKPIIATNKGLLAKIVKRNNLGVLINHTHSELITAIKLVSQEKDKFAKNNYIESHSVKKFIKIILE